MVLPLVLRLLIDAPGVAFRLLQDFLSAYGELLGLNDRADATGIAKRIVSRATGCGVLPDGSGFRQLALAN